MHDVHVYQILTPYVSRPELDPGFKVLDNTANERPDWFEYWPIRKFLLNESLDENAFYGFLSPKFRVKTGLTAETVHARVRAASPTTEVVLFSPSIHNSAYYLNVFDHGEGEHPGLKNAAKEFFGRLGLSSDLDSLVSDSRNTVFSNYFIAKPRFWRAWFAIAEQLYAIAETPTDALGKILCTPTTYRGKSDVHMKIFIMERIATWLLTTDLSFASQARDPFVTSSRIYKLPIAIVCDALKIAYTTQGRPQYKEIFLLIQRWYKLLNFKIRLGSALRLPSIVCALQTLKSYWPRDER